MQREENNVRKGNKGVCEDVAFTYGLDVVENFYNKMQKESVKVKE